MNTSHPTPSAQADEIVCFCTGVTQQQIQALIDHGADRLERITRITGACSGCGGCEATIKHMLSLAQV